MTTRGKPRHQLTEIVRQVCLTLAHSERYVYTSQAVEAGLAALAQSHGAPIPPALAQACRAGIQQAVARVYRSRFEYFDSQDVIDAPPDVRGFYTVHDGGNPGENPAHVIWYMADRTDITMHIEWLKIVKKRSERAIARDKRVLERYGEQLGKRRRLGDVIMAEVKKAS